MIIQLRKLGISFQTKDLFIHQIKKKKITHKKKNKPQPSESNLEMVGVRQRALKSGIPFIHRAEIAAIQTSPAQRGSRQGGRDQYPRLNPSYPVCQACAQERDVILEKWQSMPATWCSHGLGLLLGEREREKEREKHPHALTKIKNKV